MATHPTTTRLQEKLSQYESINEGQHAHATLMRAALTASKAVQEAVLADVEERESAPSFEHHRLARIGAEISASTTTPTLIGEVDLLPLGVPVNGTHQDVRNALLACQATRTVRWNFRRESVSGMRLLVEPGSFDVRAIEAFGQIARSELASHFHTAFSPASARDARAALLSAAERARK